jgi:hypothetical protein
MSNNAFSIAADFEQLAAETMATRGPVPVVARGGAMRMLRTDAGELVTHGDVLEGAAAKAGIELLTEGRRPTMFICACRAVVAVGARGKIPTACAKCRRKARVESGASAASAAKWAKENRAAATKQNREYRARVRAKKLPDDGLALPSFDEA